MPADDRDVETRVVHAQRAGDVDDEVDRRVGNGLASSIAPKRATLLWNQPSRATSASRCTPASPSPPNDRLRLEHLCRYALRPPVAQDRLYRSPDGRVVYELRRPFRDGTKRVIFEPLAFLARLAALVPPPRAHQTVYSGCLRRRPGFARGSCPRRRLFMTAIRMREPAAVRTIPSIPIPTTLPRAAHRTSAAMPGRLC